MPLDPRYPDVFRWHQPREVHLSELTHQLDRYFQSFPPGRGPADRASLLAAIAGLVDCSEGHAQELLGNLEGQGYVHHDARRNYEELDPGAWTFHPTPTRASRWTKPPGDDTTFLKERGR